MKKQKSEQINWLVMIPILIICFAVPPLGVIIVLFMLFSRDKIGMKKRKTATTPRGGWRDKKGNIIYKERNKD